jgi:Carbohydrate-selective porin, OprB family
VVFPWKDALLTVSGLDPNGTPSDNSFDDAFDGGVLIGSEGPVTIRPFGLVGHQLSPPGFHTSQRGVGIFFRFGASDGLVNPVKYAYNVGFAGNGIVAGQPGRRVGVGWSRIDFSRFFATL